MTELQRHRLSFRCVRPLRERPKPEDLRNLVSYLFEEPRSVGHHGPKPFSVSSPPTWTVDADLTTAVTVEVGWFDPSHDPSPTVGRALLETPDLGPVVPLRAEAWEVDAVALPELIDAPMVARATIGFVTPTILRPGDRRTPRARASAEPVLRSLSARYSRWLAPVPRWVCACYSDAGWAPQPSPVGFRGDLTIELDPEAPPLAAQWTALLLTFAELAGVGSGTGEGRGIVETRSERSSGCASAT